MTYMFVLKCALKLVLKNILYYNARSEKHQILFYVFISIYNSLHVSSTQCSSSGETNCFNTASGNNLSPLMMSTACSKHVESCK